LIGQEFKHAIVLQELRRINFRQSTYMLINRLCLTAFQLMSFYQQYVKPLFSPFNDQALHDISFTIPSSWPTIPLELICNN
jgi:hypothetical protein